MQDLEPFQWVVRLRKAIPRGTECLCWQRQGCNGFRRICRCSLLLKLGNEIVSCRRLSDIDCLQVHGKGSLTVWMGRLTPGADYVQLAILLSDRVERHIQIVMLIRESSAAERVDESLAIMVPVL